MSTASEVNISPRVVDSIEDGFGPPQRVGIIKDEEIDTVSWIYMAPAVDFSVGVSTVNWNDDITWRRFLPLGLTFV